MEKYGFVYIWFDRKHKRYYIGSHWGTEDDGYVCSSNWMRDAYRRRPTDFKRRILQKVITNRKDLLLAEERWLDLIKPEELRVRYYNLIQHASHLYHGDPQKKKSVIEKISKTRREQIAKMSPEERSAKFGYWKGKRQSEDTLQKKRGKPSWNRGMKMGPMSEEQRELRRIPCSQEAKEKISAALKGRKYKPRQKTRAPLSDEARKRISEKNKANMLLKWQDPSYRQMQLESRH